MDTSVQPFNTGGVNSPGAPPTEYPSISLDTEMMDEDELMAMGELANASAFKKLQTKVVIASQTSEPADFTLETPIDGQLQSDPSPVPGESIIANKVHLRGLDNMSSTDVKAFVGGHFPDQQVEKLEWIDDTSLNLVYVDEATAAAALAALSTESMGVTLNPWELREAKRSDAFPLAKLDIRLAFATDKKEEDRVEQQEKKRREHDRGGRRGGNGGYRQRDYEERYRSRSREGDRDLDDRRRSRSRYDEEDNKREPLELFPGGTSVDRRSGRRSRSRSPVELFPEKVKNTGVELFPEATKSGGVELFPEKVKNTNVELFPSNNDSLGQRRDGSPSEYRLATPPRTLFSIDDPIEMPKRGQSPPRQRRDRDRSRDANRAVELFPEKTDRPRSLADRIDRPRGNMRGRKNEGMEMDDSGAGLSIRGSAGGGGISIRGAARGQAGHSNAGIELLPDKAANSLFNRISEPSNSRRGARRQKAEDMFG
ncbi:hypothetical protein ABW20_dc0108535 [Dactylellina cionopaga]|nr:hypothetical protein ABW20_dc0108535 [Dactylellina cionopaga]